MRAERDGGYAEYVTVEADTLAAISDGADPIAMAALGLGGVTAFWGLQRIGPLNGKRVAITGAAGGVGSAAVAIAKAQGASVVGIVARPEQTDYVRSLGAQQVVVAASDGDLALPAESIDGVLDVVGGSLFGPCVNALRPNGVLSLVGAVARGDVRFDAWQLIRPVTLTGYSTESLTGPDLRTAIASLSDWIISGAIAPPQHRLIPLRDACLAHRALERGGISGRLLLVPSIPETNAN